MADRNGSKNVNRPIRRAFMESPSRHAVLLGEEIAEIVTEFMHSPLGDEITVDPNPVGDAVANAQPPELAQTDADQKDEEIYVAVFSALKECASDVRPHLSDDQITAMISSDQIAAQYQ